MAKAKIVVEVEFLNAIKRKIHARSSEPVDPVVASEQWHSFRVLPVNIIRNAEQVDRLMIDATNLVFTTGLSAADATFVAAARLPGATLWVSHRHTDGLAQRAEEAGVPVELLVA